MTAEIPFHDLSSKILLAVDLCHVSGVTDIGHRPEELAVRATSRIILVSPIVKLRLVA
jgi:hypothetical protein